MLNEVLEISKNELMQIIQKSEGLQTRKRKLEEEMQETKESILSLNRENRGLSIYSCLLYTSPSPRDCS